MRESVLTRMEDNKNETNDLDNSNGGIDCWHNGNWIG
jgi:hypothetical protein